jgi:hypothetical protein
MIAPGTLAPKLSEMPFVRLDVNDQAIGLQIFYRGIAEEHERRAAKLDDDFRGAPGEALAGAEIEGHAGPAPVIDLELEGDERFRVRFGSDVGLAAIADGRLAAGSAGTVLAADRTGQHIFWVERLDRVENFRLLVADFVGVERDRWLHGGHGEELEEMVRDHIAKSAGGFVKASAVFDAHGFRGGDLHVVDVIAIPERLDDVVGKPENQNVLHGFFAEVMVDAVDLIFVEDLLEFFVELTRGLQIVSERLFDDDPGPVAALLLGQSGLTQLFHNDREKSWRDGEVEKLVAARVVLLIGVGDLLIQALVSLRVLKIAFDVIDALGEPGPDGGINFCRGILGNFVGEMLPEGLRIEVVACETDDGELFGEQITGGEIAQGGNQLALGQVPGGAEDDHDAGSGYGVNGSVIHE